MKLSIAERFWIKVNKTDSCWIWEGAISRKTQRGYFSIRGHSERAYRVAYELSHGPVPEGFHVMHKCDNPRCVRPDHLILGTHRDNMNDMFAKGRRKQASGEKHGKAKLTREQVKEIRTRYATGQVHSGILSRDYGVSRSLILQIVRNQIWKEA